MRRILGIALAVVCLVTAQTAPASAYVLKPWKFQVSTVEYFLEYTVTNHSSWPGYVASYAPVWKQAESASPTLVRGYDNNTARIYIFQGNLSNPLACGTTNYSGISGSTINYVDYGYANNHTFGTSGSSGSVCDLIDTTIHELGHSLGIGHSATSAAIMYEYMPGVGKHGLHSDDINAIRARY